MLIMGRLWRLLHNTASLLVWVVTVLTVHATGWGFAVLALSGALGVCVVWNAALLVIQHWSARRRR